MSEKAMGEIESAIKIADLRSVIGKLPDGLQARLGENGSRVSGGHG